MRVIPKIDGTCPSCRLDISRVEPIEINRQPEGSVRTKFALKRPVRTPRKQVEEELAWNETGVFERTLKRGQLEELFESAQYNLIMRYVGIIWRRLFIGTFITTFIVGFFFAPILISQEFAAIEHVPALVGAIFCGLSCIYEQIANRLQASGGLPSRKRKKLFEYISQQFWRLLAEILSGLFVGTLMYFMLMLVPASLLHTIAPKEAVQFDVVVNSTGRSTKEFRKSCQYYVQFDVPKISWETQSVCIDKNQWLELRGAGYPTTIHLEGQKSYFGYELRYTK
jgi:hypothetical protein